MSLTRIPLDDSETVTLQVECGKCNEKHGFVFFISGDNAYWSHPCKALGGRRVGFRIETGISPKEEIDTWP